MANHHRRPGALNEARDDYLRVYPVAGEPTVGDGVVVNADLDLAFSSTAAAPEILVDDATGEILIDDATGEVLYEG